MCHASQHSLLYSLEHGFRDRRSCETQLLEFQADILKNLQAGMQTDMLIMDFSKAFDKVGHRLFIQKLKQAYYGIRGKTNRWIAGFLTCRTQAVVIGGECSYEACVQSRVPQSSLLGPTLFLFYVSDITENINATVRLLVDDTIAYLAIATDRDAQTLQDDLTKLGLWEQRWYMEFHPEKCHVLTISRKRNPVHHEYVLYMGTSYSTLTLLSTWALP